MALQGVLLPLGIPLQGHQYPRILPQVSSSLQMFSHLQGAHAGAVADLISCVPGHGLGEDPGLCKAWQP